MKATSFASALLAAALWTSSGWGYCPSYTASSPNNSHGCVEEAAQGTNPTVAQWQDIFALVAQGPAVWGNAGPSVGNINEGCGKPTVKHSIPPQFPCELLKAIAMAESGWQQFCVPSGPSDQVGKPSQTIISFDCGYGIGQVTSGMRIQDATPKFDRKRVANDPTYNLATGTQILAAKWGYTKCVGDAIPRTIEHWYIATWAYNGLAWSNNPNNPNLDPGRGIYNPSTGGSFTYQEKVFGRIENPPSGGQWQSVALAYPDRAECGSSGTPPALSEPSCSSPTNCTTKRVTHLSSCFGANGNAGSAGTSGTSGTSGAAGMGGTAGTMGTMGEAGMAAGSGQAGTGQAGTEQAGANQTGTSGASGNAGSGAGANSPSPPTLRFTRPSSTVEASCRVAMSSSEDSRQRWLSVAWLAMAFGWRRSRRKNS
jgi:hypothetical protein